MIKSYGEWSAINESAPIQARVEGRTVQYDGSDVIQVQSKSGALVPVRLSSSLGTMNIRLIRQDGDEYEFCGGKMCKSLDSDQINQLFSFVDTGSPTAIKSMLGSVKLARK